MKTISTILLASLLLFTLSQVDQSVLASENYQLNLSHIECAGTYIEIHFVLLNTLEGDSISDLTYTYGTIPPGPRSGNVVHFTDNVGPGYYNITSASVWVNSTLVTLHNPGDYTGNYGCQQQPTPTSTATFTPTFTPTSTSVTPTDPPKQTPGVTETPTSTPTSTPQTPTSTPTNTATFTPTSTTTTPTDPPKQTPAVTETPTNTPEPSPTATPLDPTETPTTPTVTATFSVPNTGRDDNFVGPAFMIAGLSTISLGLTLNKLWRKAYATKRK